MAAAGGDGKGKGGVALSGQPGAISMDTDIYTTADRSEYDTAIGGPDADEADEPTAGIGSGSVAERMRAALLQAESDAGAQEDPFAQHKRPKVGDRETDYQRQKYRQALSPAHADPFATPREGRPGRTFKEVMQEHAVSREHAEVVAAAKRKAAEERPAAVAGSAAPAAPAAAAAPKAKRSRWDQGEATPKPAAGGAAAKTSEWDSAPAEQPPRKNSRWDTPTPGRTGRRFDDAGAATPGTGRRRWDEPAGATPGTTGVAKGRSRWDEPAGATPGTTGPAKGRSRWDDPAAATPGTTGAAGRRSRWDDPGTGAAGGATPGATPGAGRWGDTPGTKQHRASRWGDTPAHADGDATPGLTPRRWDATPARGTPGGTVMKWDTTPLTGANLATFGATPTPKKSRWDETPLTGAQAAVPTPTAGAALGATPLAAMGATPGVPIGGYLGATPFGLAGAPTPAVPDSGVTPEAYAALKIASETDERNRWLSDADLDALIPIDGYEIVPPPATYKPITPARKYDSTPTPFLGGGGGGFAIQDEAAAAQQRQPLRLEVKDLGPDLPELKPEDYAHFAPLLQDKKDEELTKQEYREVLIMRALLKVKNGTPQQRKSAMRQLTDKARWFGAGPLFDQILPLLMSPTLEDQERHLLVKVIGRVLYKLDELVRPYVHKILVVIEPLLIDEDYYARVEGREIISNLAKAAGRPTMIATMRPDIDNVDEYVRNTTARAFAVVASALGIPALLPFLKAVIQSKRSWQARHTGVKIVQQIAILMGCAVLPHMKSLIEIMQHGLSDEQIKVKTITALALSALAEAAHPYGIEAFDTVLKPLWDGIHQHRGKPLAAFLKAIGCIIPLMERHYASRFTEDVIEILVQEMKSPDEEMRKIVLKVVKQCVATDGVEREYVRTAIMPHFFKNFWVKRMALNPRNYKQLVETTQEIAQKVGASEIVERIVDDLKHENEAYRRMVMETIEKVVDSLGTVDIDSALEERLIDGMLYAFQEQTSDEGHAMLDGFATITRSLGRRIKPYLPQIGGTIKWRLNNKNARVRQQSADLIARICKVVKQCEEEVLLGHLGVVLYEYLGEEYPEVLGSILAGLKGIVNVIGMQRMTPPIKDLLPRLTPILKNRHEKVQENCIDLVGRIADRAPDAVPAREWTRICFELLELLKAHKKAIRRAAVNTFGYIAKAVGPFDVLATLLSNLKVQERQQRVCTTVAIAIVAETCSPFTVIPGLMNEYRVPEINVQNGVLKALSFLFEYIGEMGRDYCWAVAPLLEDALTDRDPVHRQIACNVVRHMALGVAGLGCEDVLLHLMNLVWPNIFEARPHLINACVEVIEAMRVALGPAVVLMYTLQGLFHPARKVREVYWKVYNNLYIGCQDALVACYPKLPDDEANCYARRELQMLL
eukprot:TRINITY_DN60115_c0_g1_i1.p1 TRINITY_DN60115_c0_g1~~TRINITY_DN60115_c0_g1_i1.p1  ORF type:complete len:1398 (+),score=490.60 TRINITY_DN60115_c0_g1_i1:92-4285(+)